MFASYFIYKKHHNKASDKKLAKLKKGQVYLSGKTRSSINITLRPSKNYDGDLENIDLTASFSVSKEFYQLKYRWILPDNVEIIGDKYGSIGYMAPGELKNITAKIINSTPDRNSRISIEIYSEELNFKIGGLAHYNSLYYEAKKLRQKEKQMKLQQMMNNSHIHKIHE